MIDGLYLLYEENVVIFREIVEIVKGLNVFVEGEFGIIGIIGILSEGGIDEIIYIDLKLVKDFVEKIGVEILVIVIGIVYGIYLKGFKLEFKLDLLKEIREVVDIFLVFYGGLLNLDEEIV